MTPDNDRILCEKYPKIFKNRFSSPDESCMSFGFECGDGWFTLIDKLCFLLQGKFDVASYGKTEEEKEELQPVAEQVKEKFGGLRFYMSGGNDEMRGMIQMAESMSFVICEDCGFPGKKRTGGWIFTKCDSCWKQRETRTFSCK